MMSVDVCPEYGIHPGKVSLSICLEPLHDIAVEAKVNGGLPPRHIDTGAPPEVTTERWSFGSIGGGFVLALFAHCSDLAKGVSDDGRFRVHLCSLSGH